MYRTN